MGSAVDRGGPVMEKLKKLEEMQNMLMFMDSRGIASSPGDTDSDSTRFLATFSLFLMQPCGNLSFDDKCRLISDYLPKISPSFLEEASIQLDGNVCHSHSKTSSLHVDQVERAINNDGGLDKSEVIRNDMAMIGLDAMRRANSTFEDFCRSYFMFHGMDVKESIFRYLPELFFTESYIYQLDSLNESMLYTPEGNVTATDKRSNEAENHGWIATTMKIFRLDPFRLLAVLLEKHGLLTERVREELARGEEYWALERKLCGALTNKTEIEIEDVMRAIHLKSFDYRVLNLLLYQLRREEVNELHMDFLSVSELLVEIADDLFDYEEDVLENTFNVLRFFVRIYGTSNAPAMLAVWITKEEEKYNCLLKALDPELATRYQKRCEEATKEGGNTCGEHPLGSWNIPPLIADEELYRFKYHSLK